MTTFVNSFHKQVLGINRVLLKPFLKTQTHANVRGNHMFKHLSKTKEHSDEYEYEVSKEPKEWEFVERLMPLETVPVPTPKPVYPSGWRPPSDEAFKQDYYLERSKNHMLPVHLSIFKRTGKITKVKNIYGDIWKLHDELKEYVEEREGRKIASFVNEGSNLIQFKGDHVYHCEQWLLSKGF